MDLEHRPELLVGHLVCDPVPRVAGVVHDDVELPELRDRLLDEGLADSVLREVAGKDRRLALDLRCGLGREVGVDVRHQNARSLRAEQFRRRPADPACGSGHDRSLPLEHPHAVPASFTSASDGSRRSLGSER